MAIPPDVRKTLEFGIEEIVEQLVRIAEEAVDDALGIGYISPDNSQLLHDDFTAVIEKYLNESD